jgi:transglutaminase-like putative cysteine protease
MSLNRRFRALVFVQVLLGVVAFGLVRQSVALLMGLGAVAALSWYVTEGPRARYLPGWVIHLGVLAAAGWLGFAAVTGRMPMLVAVAYFVLAVQLLLLFGRKQTREYAQLLVLSAMLMIAAGAIGRSLLFGLLIVGYGAVAFMTLLLFQLKLTHDQVLLATEGAAPRGRSREARVGPVAGLGVARDFRRMALGVGLLSVAIGAGIFAFLPRIGLGASLGQGSSWTEPGARLGQSMNLSEGLKPAGQSPVATLRITGSGTVSSVHEKAWLLRGRLLSRYDPETHRWLATPSRLDRALMVPAAAGGVALVPGSMAQDTVEATITYCVAPGHTLFTVQPAQGHSPGPTHLATPGADTPLRWMPGRAVLKRPGDSPGGWRYRLRFPLNRSAVLTEGYYAQLGSGAAPDLAPPADSLTRAWPVQHERVRQLAEHAIRRHRAEGSVSGRTDQVSPRLQRAQALTRFLRQRYRYTLNAPASAGQRDPVIAFLFDHRRGHCELFASGLAALARSVGIPARIVTGYRVSEFNDWGRYYVARGRNAHAWTELYLGSQRGWVTFDATPASAVAREHAAAGGWWQSVRHGYEHLEAGWLRHVIGYGNHDGTSAAGDKATPHASTGGGWLAALGEGFETLPGEGDWLEQLAMVSIVVLVLLAGVILGRLYLHRRRRLAQLQLANLPRARRRQLVRQLQFYLLMLDMLDRHGYYRPPWQSPFGFAEQLARREPVRLDPVVSLTELFYEIRFGYRTLNADRQQRVRAHLRQLEYTLSRRSLPPPIEA